MKKYKGFQAGWWVVFVTLSVVILKEYIPSNIFGGMYDKNFIQISALFEPLMIIPVIIGVVVAKVQNPFYKIRDILGFHTFEPEIIMFLLFLPLFAKSYLSIVSLPYISATSVIFPQVDSLIFVPKNINEFICDFIMLCIMAPLFEELIFRGILINLFNRYGSINAVIFSSLAFSMLHSNVPGFFVIFGLGIILGVIRYTTNSIFACMIFHFAANFFGLLGIVFVDSVEKMVALNTVFIILTSIAFPFVFIWYLKTVKAKAEFTKQQYSLGVSVALILVVTVIVLLAVIPSIKDGIANININFNGFDDVFNSIKDNLVNIS